MSRATVTVTLIVEGADAWDAVDAALDEGILQDAINASEYDARVVSAVVS